MSEITIPEIESLFEDEPEDDSDESDFGPNEFNAASINIQPRTDSLRNLIERLRHDEIDMNTDFQRRTDLWTNAQMSRLIESILIRFPIPPFYFDATDDSKWLVIDGLQRLSTIRKFVINENLRLSHLEYLKELNGKSFNELDRRFIRQIDEYPVSLYLIQPGTAAEVKYSIFRRINTSGVTLNRQEIRNALATPRVRQFLNELTQNTAFLATIGDQSRRMADQHLVLRFLAFFTQDYQKKPRNIADFIDDVMEKLKASHDSELAKLKTDFERAISCCHHIFGKRAFEIKTESGEKRIRKNASLFEALMVCIARIPEKNIPALLAKKEDFAFKFLEMTTGDVEFNASISFATQKREHVLLRHQKIRQLIDEVCHA